MKQQVGRFLGAVALMLLVAAAFYPIAKPAPTSSQPMPTVPAIDLSGYSPDAPGRPVNLLFIHHSVGGQLMADQGPHVRGSKTEIYPTHPNGGGLRRQLEADGYQVHEASYSSVVGEKTDLFDWLPKFRTQMGRVLATRHQDELLEQGSNQVVMFKSCFPNSFFRPDKTRSGTPAGPVLTLSNAQATLLAVRTELAKHPETLFVYFTAPPLRAHDTREPLFKYVAKRLLGRETDDVEQLNAAATARAFNDWVKSRDGWLKGYAGRNIVVFDYYDVLTGHQSNFLLYPSNGGRDDHPSAQGQRIAASEFVPFLNRAVRYAGIVD
jgi:hypothetical protein